MAGRAMLVHVERTHLLSLRACSSVDTTAGLRGSRRTAVPCCARLLTQIRPDSARSGRCPQVSNVRPRRGGAAPGRSGRVPLAARH
ncbi:hypothetical protein CJO79_20355 (plasmid) [Ralstonia solanacearum]|nr:hypothetical protein CJO76_20380 [Ralstonia solanacearum]AXV93328.1 hypothetical protein CJO79_20355 [Ralstonia solanacearum]AXW21360.1 hypothetical protein CJO85_20440 [Ralstonia solanacearum]AXW78225.1 hypothetical protein CJO97_20355 [Ralstonia solanacearum]